MKLEEMRKIAEQRTKGKWEATSDLPKYAVACGDKDIFATENRLYRTWDKKHGANQQDAQFIALAANVFDQLLDVAEAARELAVLCREELGHDKPEITHVYWLLKKLEEL